MLDKPTKTCFVICPIGDPETEFRAWSDDMFNGLVNPIAKEFSYSAWRSIDRPRPGEITPNIIRDVIDADLVVADLTFHNGNVFYELCLRHIQRKPFVQVAVKGTKVPFDISQINTVFIDQNGFIATEKTKAELREHFQAVENGTASYDNPVSRHYEHLRVQEKGTPLEKQVLALADGQTQLAKQFADMRAEFERRVAAEAAATEWAYGRIATSDEALIPAFRHQIKYYRAGKPMPAVRPSKPTDVSNPGPDPSRPKKDKT